MIFIYVIIYLILCFIVAYYGKSKEIGYNKSLLISIFLSPIVGFLVVILSKDLLNEEYKERIINTQIKNNELLEGVINVQINITDELLKLANLKSENIITEEEFKVLKNNLLHNNKSKTTIVAPSNFDLSEYHKKDLIKELSHEELENINYQELLKKLRKSIDDQTGKMINGGMNIEIENQLIELTKSKNEALHLLYSYKEINKCDLIQDLIKLNSSYHKIKNNVSIFINYDIVESEYPHKLV